MDVSETWPFVILVLLAIVAWVAFRLCKRIQSRWRQRYLRTAASLVIVGSAICLLFLLLFSLACTKSTRPIYSPDGRHVAFLRYAFQGALGDDYATVKVRSTWNPFAELAYSGLGSWDFKN